jgi:hypothetical protein
MKAAIQPNRPMKPPTAEKMHVIETHQKLSQGQSKRITASPETGIGAAGRKLLLVAAVKNWDL